MLVSEPVRGRSRATELPCMYWKCSVWRMWNVFWIVNMEKLACISVGFRRCAGVAQISVSEGEVGHFGSAWSDLRGVRLGSPRSPEESAWIHNCDLTCVGHFGDRGWRPIGGCWCCRKIHRRSDCPSLIREYPSFRGRSKSACLRNS